MVTDGDPIQTDRDRRIKAQFLWQRGGKDGKPLQLQKPIGRSEHDELSVAQKADYTGIREKINDSTVTGPLDTGLGSTDFDAQLRDAKLGLPTLPGQTTNGKH